MPSQITSANFGFLAVHDTLLVQLGAQAERHFKEDPVIALIKLRQFGEVLAKVVAAKAGLYRDPMEGQADVLRRLKFEQILPSQVADLFHHIRLVGNKATHDNNGNHAEALTALKIGRELGVWFHRTFGADKSFRPGPFVPPQDPLDATKALSAELARLNEELDRQRTAAERAQAAAEANERAKLSAEELAQKEREDRATWEQIAAETEAEKASLAAQLQAIQAAAEQAPAQVTADLTLKAEAAASLLNIDETSTRQLIDQQLRDRGWEVDTQTIRYGTGSRPTKGKNMAIAEWPTKSGPADYALFVGLRCIAVIEAKRRNRKVSSSIDQAERYAQSIRLEAGSQPVDGGPWKDSSELQFHVPFVFSANGRPYLKQVETESGIWFRDVRRATNHRRALVDWPTPDGLLGLLEIDVTKATADLKEQLFDFGFPIRSYQRTAIEKVEAEIARGNRTMLLAMATGTGKTKLAIAMLYRLLAAKRFRRVCFVVDRNALGTQAAGEFSTTRIVSWKTFSEIFGLKGLETVVPEPETKVHICTIQGLVKRVLYAAENAEVPPIDQYDLIIVDECHRGYLLDRDLSEGELTFRSQDDYVSKYRRVLEHFDAVKIGLTATPALHTVDIFGKPIFTYSYREAVIDGHLIDHEPPIQITTALSKAGIKFQKGEALERLNTKTGKIDLATTPDVITFEVDEFNKAVITRAFNRTVAQELAKHIDPKLPGKTLIFAVTDAHADIVVDEMKQAFAEAYGEIEDGAVRKITGSVDKPGRAILAFRNDALPKIVVTVDLLTTGVDVPSIVNLVFLRRVNSRILYEQMLGRATRQCPEIGKQVFKIFDAVDLYPQLQKLTEMKPVVVDPQISFERLMDEFSGVTDSKHLAEIRGQLLVKLRRRLRSLDHQVRAQYESRTGETPEQTLARLQLEPPQEFAAWLKKHPGIGKILDFNPNAGRPVFALISNHPDQVVGVSRGYGKGQKPADFLDSFSAFIRDNVNKLAALHIVLQRPRDLTRAELKSLRLALDGQGYSETSLRKAWAETKNEDIAASIVGFIRQAALGDALTPMGQLVDDAMKRILAKKPWTDVQRRWLERIAKQLVREVVVDRASIDEEPFRADGGFNRLNKIFDGQLESVLGDINEEVWRKAS